MGHKSKQAYAVTLILQHMQTPSKHLYLRLLWLMKSGGPLVNQIKFYHEQIIFSEC